MAKQHFTRDLFAFATETEPPAPPTDAERRTVHFANGSPSAYRAMTLEEAAERAAADKSGRLKKNLTKIGTAKPTPRTQRQPTVAAMKARSLLVVAGFAPNNHVPFLHVGGLWLAKAGFALRTRVRVQVEPGRLIITPEESS